MPSVPQQYSILALLLPFTQALLKSPYPSATDKSVDTAGLLNPTTNNIHSTATLPIPTTAPQYGSVAHGFLFARQETLTCGYFDGNPSRPNLCGRGSACFFATNDYFGCCTTTGGCGTPLRCATYTGGAVAGPVLIDGGRAVSCGSNAPFCQTTIFPTVKGLAAVYGEGPYRHFDCVESASSVLTLYQDTNLATATSRANVTSTSTSTRTSDSTSGTISTDVLTIIIGSSSTMTSDVDSSTTTTTTTTTTSSVDVGTVEVSSTATTTMVPTFTGGAAVAQRTVAAGAMVLALAAGRAFL